MNFSNKKISEETLQTIRKQLDMEYYEKYLEEVYEVIQEELESIGERIKTMAQSCKNALEDIAGPGPINEPDHRLSVSYRTVQREEKFHASHSKGELFRLVTEKDAATGVAPTMENDDPLLLTSDKDPE